MRFANLLYLLPLPFSALALPHQRRTVTVKGSAAGTSELVAAGEKEAASPPTTSHTIATENEAPPAIAATNKARPEDPLSIPPEVFNPPEGVDPSYVQKIVDAWKEGRGEDSVKIQRLLKEISNRADEVRNAEIESLEKEKIGFHVGQTVKIHDHTTSENTKFRKYWNHPDTDQSQAASASWAENRNEDIIKFYKKLGAEKSEFAMASLIRQATIDTKRLKIQAWTDTISQRSQAKSESASELPPALEGKASGTPEAASSRAPGSQM